MREETGKEDTSVLKQNIYKHENNRNKTYTSEDTKMRQA